ncbi:hypothetical protein ACFQL9_00380 [Halobaculum lipolyticum]|uniref:PGF-pre-PGF domain-containing protein n=1 Tax=Halobaculum lipolyticum TaxID=3032001 RepID=A0ABD5W5B7_9EURY
MTLTTPSRASDYLDNSSAVLGGDSDGLALVISDSVNHEGREVALPMSSVKAALGYVPDLVHGVHDDGSTWTRSVREESGLLVFEVPHFSDNAVTFESTVSVAASPATNGTSLSWGLSDLDAASDVSVNLTGVNNTERASVSGMASSGDEISVSVEGSYPPTNATVSIDSTSTASSPTTTIRETDRGGSGPSLDHSTTINTDTSRTITRVESEVYVAHDTETSDHYFGYGVYLDGTKLMEVYNDGSYGGTTYSGTWTGSIEVSEDPVLEYRQINSSGGATEAREVIVDAAAEDGSITFAGDRDSVTFTTPGEKPIDLAKDDSLAVSGDAVTGYTVSWDETTETQDPGVELGNCSESYPGTLPAGDTATLTLNSSCLSETNELTVTVGGDLSADAPAPQVAVVAEHTAASNQTVEYAGDAWSERYNVSKTWASSRSDARLVIPFASEVVSIRDVEFRTDSSSWTGTSNYELDGTTLTVDLGSVDAGETTRVRVNGSRVRVENGSITVTSPTIAGNTLDSEFRIDSWSDSSYIAVGGSASGEFVHHLVSESWTSPSESVVVEAGGQQRIYAPKAPEGGTARARTIPVEVQPENDVRVSVTDPTQPSFEVGPASTSGDAYDVVYHDTVTGDTYRLVSETRDGYVIDEATASSPVTFTDPEDDTELLSIVKANETTGSAGGGGGGGGGAAPAEVRRAGGLTSSPLVVGPLGVALVLGAFVVARRTRIPIWATAPASVVAFVVVLETLAPGTVSDVVRRLGVEVASGIGQVSSALILAGGAVALWGVYRVVKRFTRKDQVALTLRRGS